MQFSPLQRYAVDLTGVSGRRARMAIINTAGGDQRVDEGRELAAAAAAGVDATHVRLFGRNHPDLREVVLSSDVVWVGGGSVANLLAVWRLHGLDVVLREAAEAGVLLSGTSAGAICWHVGGPTSTFGQVEVITNGLALIPGSVGVHYDSQPERRPALAHAVSTGALPAGFGLDEGTGILYEDAAPVEFLTEGDGGIWSVGSDGERRVDARVIS